MCAMRMRQAAHVSIRLQDMPNEAIAYTIVVAIVLVSGFAGFVWLTMRRRRLRLQARAYKLVAKGVLSDDDTTRDAALAEVRS